MTGELAELELPAGKTHLGALTVRRTPVKGRTSFRYSVAVKAGALDPGQVSEFVSVGQGYDRWEVERDGEGPLVDPEDFGEEAPF